MARPPSIVLEVELPVKVVEANNRCKYNDVLCDNVWERCMLLFAMANTSDVLLSALASLMRTYGHGYVATEMCDVNKEERLRLLPSRPTTILGTEQADGSRSNEFRRENNAKAQIRSLFASTQSVSPEPRQKSRSPLSTPATFTY